MGKRIWQRMDICVTALLCCTPEINTTVNQLCSFPVGSVVMNLPVNAGDTGSIPGSRKSPGEGNGYPLQYTWLENATDRGAWQTTVHRVAKESNTTATKQQHKWTMKVKVLVVQSCPTLCNPMNCSPPGPSVHGILQARILEWVAIPFSGDLPDSGMESGSSALQADSLPSEPLRKPFKKESCSQCNMRSIHL